MRIPILFDSDLSPPIARPLPRSTILPPGWRTVGSWLVIGFTVLLASVAVGRTAELKLPQLWQSDLESFLETSATVADINGDGREEVLVAGREELFARDGNGKALWGWRTKTRFMTYPAVLTRLGQASLIYVADTGGVMTCLDGKGKEVWHAQLKGPARWTASVVCDLDGDGAFEVIQADEAGTVWAFAALTGKPIWQTTIKGIPVSPAVGDLDGDGKPEIVVATGEGIVTALNGSGQILWERKIGGYSQSWGTSAAVIFAGSDGRGRIAAASSDGQFFCLDSKGEILWQRTTRGTAASTISVGDLDLDGRADVCLITQVGVIYRFDESGRVIWEIDMQGRSLAPGAMIDLDGDGKLEYALCTQDGFLQVLNHAGEFLHRFHFNNRTINVTPTFGDVSADLPGSEAGDVQAALEKSSALVAGAKRALTMADVIRHATALGPGTSLVAFEGTMWENRKVDEQLPVRAANPLRLSRTAVPGEHEPVALNLFNVTDHELLVRVQMDPLTNGVIVTPHRSVGVPTSLGEVAWDALPELDETGTLAIPPLTSRELWLDVDLAAAKPGEHPVKLRLQALNGAGVLDAPTHPHTVSPPETTVEISLRLLPFAMVPSGDFRLCTWAAPEEANLPDLLAHGNNVFPVALPEVQYDAQGRLASSDFSKLDPVLGRLRGQDVVLLLQGLPALHAEVGSAGYRDELKKFLAELVGHMADAGFDTNHFALYPFDEPGGVGWGAVNQLVAFGKQVRAANPSVMLYMDGGGELPMFEAMASCMDIWTPSIYMLAEKTPLMDVVRKTGKMLWSYNCAYAYARPIGPNIKNMNLIGDYRAAAPFAFRHGATGIGFWCYNIGADPWGRIDMEYMLVYPGRTKPVTSRRWEAVREGIEDYRILAALRKLLAADGGAKLTDDARSRIKHLLEVSLPGTLDQSLNEMTRGLGRSVLDASNNDSTINALRREMIDCVEAVAR